MVRLSRRETVAGLTASLLAVPARAQTQPWAPWKDMLNWLTTTGGMNAARRGRGRADIAMEIQKIEDAKGVHVNFDTYAVEVTRPPAGALADRKALFNYIRVNLNDFFDHAVASVAGYEQGDTDDWKRAGPAPLGAVMEFKIEVLQAIHERAAVVTSASGDLSFVFSPVTIGLMDPGEHPVSGNRMFRLEPTGGAGFRLVTRAADRAIDSPYSPLPPSEDDVFSGGDKLWRSWQQAVAAYINNQGGAAAVIAPQIVTPRPPWDQVKASGLFDRA